MNCLRHVVRGCGTLPKCGPHPGTIWLAFFILTGAIAVSWLGAVVTLGFFGPLYLYGAYERSREDG
jgi:hypothetical protein